MDGLLIVVVVSMCRFLVFSPPSHKTLREEKAFSRRISVRLVFLFLVVSRSSSSVPRGFSGWHDAFFFYHPFIRRRPTTLFSC